MAAAAAAEAARVINGAHSARGVCNIMVATGNSQLAFYEALAREQIPWAGVNVFHIDEYVGIPATHSASFRKYLHERLETVVKPKSFSYLAGDAADAQAECARYTALLRQHPLDLCVLGVRGLRARTPHPGADCW